ARDRGEGERQNDRRAGPGPVGVAGGRRAYGREDTGPDHRADPEHRQVERGQRALERVLAARLGLTGDPIAILGPKRGLELHWEERSDMSVAPGTRRRSHYTQRLEGCQRRPS